VSDLRSEWERHAAQWIAWARTPGHDSYWQFHRDVFLEMVPPPAGRTLDLGCGEGRLARDLDALGHDIVGVDSSPTLVSAAREASPAIELHLADAADLPFEDASFDLVVAFMSLQDVDDLGGALRESARVLIPGGRLCLAVVHPLGSAGAFTVRDAAAPFVIESSYLDSFEYADAVARGGLEMTFASLHRPLHAYADELSSAAFLIERLREVALPEHAFTDSASARWRRIPLFLHVRAVKPG
jgi:SAM-dependent methyltransferase